MTIDPSEYHLLAALAKAFATPCVLHKYGPEPDEIAGVWDGEPRIVHPCADLDPGLYRLGPAGEMIEIVATEMFAAFASAGIITPMVRH